MRNPRYLTTTLTTLALLSTAPAALAQDFCAGAGAGGQWIGGSEDASDIATVTDIQEQMALVIGGNDYVALFTLSEPTAVRAEAQGRGAGDPQLDLIDATGAIVISDDDSGGNAAARAEARLNPGTYCVAVRSYDGSPMTSFVRITRTDQDALTEGAEAVTVAPVDSPDPDAPALPSASCTDARLLEGTLADGGLTGTASAEDTGFWQFALDAPAMVTVRAENSDADPMITVSDAQGVLLGENDDFDGLNAEISFEDSLPAGDYCIAIDALDDSSLPITTTVTVFDPQAALVGQALRGEIAPPTDGTVAITDLGTLTRRLVQDVDLTADATWFAFDMPAAGLLLAELATLTDDSDAWMVLFDDLGRQVLINDDYGDSLDSLIAARVTGGRYFVGVRRLEEDGAGPARLLLEHFVPAP